MLPADYEYNLCTDLYWLPEILISNNHNVLSFPKWKEHAQYTIDGTNTADQWHWMINTWLQLPWQ